MTISSSAVGCTDICSATGSVDPSCGCSAGKSQQKAKAAKYGAGFITLCAICCAVPPALIALGFVSITTGAYFSAGSTVALVLLAVSGIGYSLIQFVKRKR